MEHLVLAAAFLLSASTISTVVAQDDPCDPHGHRKLNASSRLHTVRGNNGLCDKNLPVAWYKLEVNGNPAEIPTVCLKHNVCGTKLPMHIDLGYQGMPQLGNVSNATVCTSYNILGRWDCCVLRQDIQIKNCGTFYVYKLKHTDRCPVAYCAQEPSHSPSSELTLKRGDVYNEPPTLTLSTESSTERGSTTEQQTNNVFDVAADAVSPEPVNPLTVTAAATPLSQPSNISDDLGNFSSLIHSSTPTTFAQGSDVTSLFGTSSENLTITSLIQNITSVVHMSAVSSSAVSTQVSLGTGTTTEMSPLPFSPRNHMQSLCGNMEQTQCPDNTTCYRDDDGNIWRQCDDGRGCGIICDNLADCRDESDEKSDICNYLLCIEGQEMCSDRSHCFTRCDGKDECNKTVAGEDEDGCQEPLNFTAVSTPLSPTSASQSATPSTESNTTITSTAENATVSGFGEGNQTLDRSPSVTVSTSPTDSKNISIYDVTSELNDINGPSETGVETTVQGFVSSDATTSAGATAATETISESEYKRVGSVPTTHGASGSSWSLSSSTEASVTSDSVVISTSVKPVQNASAVTDGGSQISTNSTVVPPTTLIPTDGSVNSSYSLFNATTSDMSTATPLVKSSVKPSTAEATIPLETTSEIETDVSTVPRMSQSTETEVDTDTSSVRDLEATSTLSHIATSDSPQTDDQTQVFSATSAATQTAARTVAARTAEARVFSLVTRAQSSSRQTTAETPPRSTPYTSVTSTEVINTTETLPRSSSQTQEDQTFIPTIPYVTSATVVESTETIVSATTQPSTSASTHLTATAEEKMSSSRHPASLVTASSAVSSSSSAAQLSSVPYEREVPEATSTSNQTFKDNSTVATVEDAEEATGLFYENFGLFVFLIVAGAIVFGICVFGIIGFLYQRRLRTWDPSMAYQDAYVGFEKSSPFRSEKRGVENPIPDVDILKDETAMNDEEISLSQASTLALASTPGKTSLPPFDDTFGENSSEQLDGSPLKDYKGMANGHTNEAFEADDSMTRADNADGIVPVEDLDTSPPRTLFPWIENAEDTKL